MALRCQLLGHKWSNWNYRSDEYEKTEPIEREGNHIGEHIYSVWDVGRTCERCGKSERKEEREKKEERRFDFRIDAAELPPAEIEPNNILSEDGLRSFFKNLKEFVNREKEATRRRNRETHDRNDLDSDGNRTLSTGPFQFIDDEVNGETKYWFELTEEGDRHPDNETVVSLQEDISWNDLCLIDSPELSQGFPFEGRISDVRGQTLAISPRWKTIEDEAQIDKHLREKESRIFLYRLLNPLPFDRRLKSIRAAENRLKKKNILAGNQPAKFSYKYPAPDSPLKLNSFQQKALAWADCANDFILIHGPPGTGKTRTLTAYVRHAVEKGESVLVTAHSNQAVDNVLVGDSTVGKAETGTLHAMARDEDVDLSISRVGDGSKNSVVKEYHNDSPVSETNVVAATTSGAAEFDIDEFDVAVVDEATQASRPATASAVNCAKKVILAGDHRQLPPFSIDKEMQEGNMDISLFEYLLERYGDQISVFLQRQYRMNEAIAEFPNQAFYDGQLKTANRNRNWQVDDLNPLVGLNIKGPEKQHPDSDSYYNPKESEAVAKQVKLLVQSGLDSGDIGVISAYDDQVTELKNRISKLDIRRPGRVDIDTVDSFQGGEREAIIVSFVRSNTENNSGFLEVPDVGPRRLNVSLTRARKRLVLIGDWETLGSISSHRSQENSCAPLFRKLENYLRARGRMDER